MADQNSKGGFSISRRGAFSAAAASIAAAACAPGRATAYEGKVSFVHGVASGDPGDTRVVIWTRVSPAKPGPVPVRWVVARDPKLRRVVQSGLMETDANRDYTVKADVQALEPGKSYYYGFIAGEARSPVGRAKTLPTAQTEQVRFAIASCSNFPFGLFNAYAEIAKTPDLDAVLHLGDYIYEYGHDGYGGQVGLKIGRANDPATEIQSLEDYRRRHAQYKSDPDLQAAHAAAPWITIWDDHEFTNDAYLNGAQNHNPEKGEGDWAARKKIALQAYYEWMPIRDPQAGRPADAIFRSFQFGDLATLIMLETRVYARAQQLDYAKDMPLLTQTWDMGAKPPAPVAPGAPQPAKAQTLPAFFDVTGAQPAPIFDFARVSAFDPKALPAGVSMLPDVKGFVDTKLNAPERELLGPEQMTFVSEALKASMAKKTTWQVFGNQVVMARVNAPDLSKLPEPVIAAIEKEFPPIRRFIQMTRLGLPLNLDAWDGYPAARERFYDLLRAAEANPIVVTGDTHSAWAMDLKSARDPAALIGVEFAGTSITSPSLSDMLGAGQGFDLGAALTAKNEDIRWTDQRARGFLLLTLKKDEARAEFMRVSSILSKDFKTDVEAAFRVRPKAGPGINPMEPLKA